MHQIHGSVDQVHLLLTISEVLRFCAVLQIFLHCSVKSVHPGHCDVSPPAARDYPAALIEFAPLHNKFYSVLECSAACQYDCALNLNGCGSVVSKL